MLELISEVQIEVRLLRAVAVADGGTYGAEHRIVVESTLYAEQRAVVEEFLQLVSLLGSGYAEQDLGLGADALLSLQLCSHELLLHIFHIAYAGEGHLLLHIVTEKVTADGVAEDGGHHIT